MNGANRHHRSRRVDRHTTAIKMVQGDDAIHIRKAWQQIPFNDLHDMIHHTRHAVDTGGDAEEITRTHAAIRIPVTFKGVTF